MDSKDHPKNLPDIETIEDILLDIKDTNEYRSGKIEIVLNGDNYQLHKMGFSYKPQRELKVVYEAIMPRNLLSPVCESSGASRMGVSIKKTEYQIFKLLAHLAIQQYDTVTYETIVVINDTIQRIKDYLGDSVIKEYGDAYNKYLLFNIHRVTILGSSVG